MNNKGMIVFNSILIAVIAIIAVIIGVYWDKVKLFLSGEALLTVEQGQEKYEEGYEKGTANMQTLQTQINAYRQTIEENEVAISNLQLQIQTLQEQSSANQSLISELQEQISSLQSQNTELQNLVDAYEDALPILVEENQAIVKFMVGNELKDIQVIDKNSTITNPYQVSFEDGNVSTFNGWKVNGETIDISTYVVTDHVVLIADITEKVQVVYTVNGESLSSEIILSSTKPNYPTLTGYESYFFQGWYNGDIKIDTDTFVATENITLNAVVKQTITATFMANDTVYSTQSLTKNDALQTPTAPTQIIDNKPSRFNGWKVNGEFVDLTTYAMTEDTTFVADFSKKINVYVAYYVRLNAGETFYSKTGTDVQIHDYYFAGDVIDLHIDYLTSTTDSHGCTIDCCYYTSNGLTIGAKLDGIYVVNGKFPNSISQDDFNTVLGEQLIDNVSTLSDNCYIAILVTNHNNVY